MRSSNPAALCDLDIVTVAQTSPELNLNTFICFASTIQLAHRLSPRFQAKETFSNSFSCFVWLMQNSRHVSRAGVRRRSPSSTLPLPDCLALHFLAPAVLTRSSSLLFPANGGFICSRRWRRTLISF